MKTKIITLENGWQQCQPVLDTKKIKLFTKEGYPDFKAIRDKGYPFNIIYAGRGTGKSVSALKDASEDESLLGRVIYMRRRETIATLMTDMRTSQFAKLAAISPDLELDVAKSEFGGVYKVKNKFGGYIVPLSTFAKARGIDYSSVDLVIFDEICPESNERVVTDEGRTFDNALETIGRNRELYDPNDPNDTRDGPQPPVQVLCLGNTEKLTAPLLIYMNLARDIWEMVEKKIDQRYYPERGIALFNLYDSPISKMKANTALYIRNKGSSQNQMAIENRFVYDTTFVKRKDIQHYKHIIGIGSLNIYRHKSGREYYVTDRKTTDCLYPREISAFRSKYRGLYLEYLNGRIYFADTVCLALFLEYMGIKENY